MVDVATIYWSTPWTCAQCGHTFMQIAPFTEAFCPRCESWKLRKAIKGLKCVTRPYADVVYREYSSALGRSFFVKRVTLEEAIRDLEKLLE